jgi:hypothetical protein
VRIPNTLLLVACLAAPAGALGGETAEPEADTEPQAAGKSDSKQAPDLDMNRLLQVPDSSAYERVDLLGGKNRETWTQEFTEARLEVGELESQIEKSTLKLREIAPNDWSFSPTGAGPQSDPAVLQLRSQLRRDRQSLQTAQRRLRDLEIEASLAGVPDEWKYPEEPE